MEYEKFVGIQTFVLGPTTTSFAPLLQPPPLQYLPYVVSFESLTPALEDMLGKTTLATSQCHSAAL